MKKGGKTVQGVILRDNPEGVFDIDIRDRTSIGHSKTLHDGAEILDDEEMAQVVEDGAEDMNVDINNNLSLDALMEQAVVEDPAGPSAAAASGPAAAEVNSSESDEGSSDSDKDSSDDETPVPTKRRRASAARASTPGATPSTP
eukprot:875800-Alexandrium_andersonii.AAC.1